jgi:predicted nucleotidyltransferase component of viral defense system
MLNLESISASYPPELQWAKRFMLREYLQCKILEILFNSPFADRFCFIGGTCLRLIHNNRRFSEDLDFDFIGLAPDDFQATASLLVSGLEKEGLIVETKVLHSLAYHCYIRFPNILYDNQLSGHTAEKILIQIDAEAQGFAFEPEVRLLSRFDTISRIRCAPKSLLLAQKCFAILNRKRNKGRDFYDVEFLLSMGVKPDFVFLQLKASLNNPEELKAALLNHCASIDMEEMAKDVEPFLFQPNEAKKVAWFKEIIVQDSF